MVLRHDVLGYAAIFGRLSDLFIQYPVSFFSIIPFCSCQ